MMVTKILFRAAASAVVAATVLASATPASAARTLCSSGPVIDLVTEACVWSGNDREADVEAALLAALGTGVDLTLYGKSDDNTALFSFTPGGDPDGLLSVNWSVLDGTLIKFVTVKASGEFKVFELAGPGASSGIADTVDLLTKNGKNRPEISHISFWTRGTAAVPEPEAWAMLVMGFGTLGAAMRTGRRRRRALA